jgi:hypothetical protein
LMTHNLLNERKKIKHGNTDKVVKYLFKKCVKCKIIIYGCCLLKRGPLSIFGIFEVGFRKNADISPPKFEIRNILRGPLSLDFKFQIPRISNLKSLEFEILEIIKRINGLAVHNPP